MDPHSLAWILFEKAKLKFSECNKRKSFCLPAWMHAMASLIVKYFTIYRIAKIAKVVSKY